MLKYYFLAIILYHFCALNLPAQVVIDAQNTDLSVCSAGSRLSVCLDPSVNLDSVRVQLNFPPGVQYVPNSFSVTSASAGVGIIEWDISNLNTPIFAVQTAHTDWRLASTDNICFSVNRSAACAAISHALSMQIFKDTILVSSPTASIPSDDNPNVDAYTLLYGALSILSAPDVALNAIGDVGVRTLQITNGGLGCVPTFDLVRTVQTGISPSAGLLVNGVYLTPSSVVGNSATFTIASASVGLGVCIENGELLTIQDTVKVLACNSLNSLYSLRWGCNGADCQNTSTAPVQATIQLPPGLPNLVTGGYNMQANGSGIQSIGRFTTLPDSLIPCYANLGNRVGIKIKNIGTAPARLVRLFAFTDAGINLYEHLDPNSFGVFRSVVDSQQVFVDTSILHSSPGQCVDGQVRGAGITIPFIGAGDSAIVYFTILTCCSDKCNNDVYDPGRVLYNLSAVSNCNDTTRVERNATMVLGRSFIFGSESNPPTLVTGANQVLSTNIDYSDLGIATSYTDNYEFRYRIVLPPCGANFVTSVNSIRWMHVPSNTAWLPYSVVRIGDTVEARFNPRINPLNFGLVTNTRIDVHLQGLCATCLPVVPLTARCDTSNPIAPYLFPISKRLEFLPCPSGGGTACIRTLYCATPSIELPACVGAGCSDGLIGTGSTFERITFGLPDNDNNGQADVSGVIDKNAVALEASIIGDTSLLRAKYEVLQRDSTMRYAYIRLNIDTLMGFAGGSFNYYDISTGAVFACPLQVVSRAGSSILLDMSPTTACGAPAGFVFEAGDSLVLNAYFRTNYEDIGNRDYSGVLTGNAYASSYPNPTRCEDMLVCGGAGMLHLFKIHTVSAYSQIDAYLPDLPCGNNYFGIYHQVGVGRASNTFRFEYRNMVVMDSFKVVVPSNWVFAYNQYISVFNPTGIFAPNRINGDTLVFYTNLQADDYYAAIQGLFFKPTCRSGYNFATADPFIFQTYFRNDQYKGNNIPLFRNFVGTRAAHRRAQISLSNVSTSIVQGTTDTVSWVVRVSNNNNALAPNLFLSYPNSGNIRIHRVENASTGAAYPNTSDIYQLGNLPTSNSIDLRIFATYTNCNLDSIPLYAGWDCEAYPTNLAAYACTLTQGSIGVQPQPAEVQLALTAQPANASAGVQLCDTLRYTLVVNSAQTANLSEPFLFIDQPAGLNFIPNLIQVEYPLNSGNVEVLTASQAGLTLQINLAQHSQIAQEGIKGTTRANNLNERAVRVQLAYLTDCNFISGRQLNFRVRANNPCGVVAIGDNLNLASSRINLAGAPIPYTAFSTVSLPAGAILGCNTSTQADFSIAIGGGGSTGANDTAQIQLPAGVELVAASYVCHPTTLADGFCPTFVPNGSNGFRLVYPSGIPSGYIIRFSVQLRGNASQAACGSEQIDFSSTYRQNGLFCPTIGANCPDISALAGQNSLAVLHNRATVSLASFSAAYMGLNTYQISGAVANLSALPTDNPIWVEIYESDPLGNATSPLLLALPTAALINANSTQAFSGTLNHPFANNFIAEIRSLTQAGVSQCLCLGARGFSVLLPAQLLSFKAQAMKNCTHQLGWELANTEQLSAIVLEKSEDGVSFKPISAHTPAQNQGSFLYTPNPSETALYYRLKMIDRSETIAYSYLVQAGELCEQDVFRVYPNPVKSEFMVELLETFENPCLLRISLLNPLGQVVKTESLQTNGNAQIAVSVADLSAGAYQLRVEIGTNLLKTQLLIIQTP